VVKHRSSECADMSSDIGNSGAGPQEVDPRQHTSYQLGRSLDHEGAHACGVDDAFRRNTSKEPLEEIKPKRVTFWG